RGVYAAALMERQPLLPIEEESGFSDAMQRDNFLERVFAYSRWRTLLANGVTPARLVEFHTAHKLMLMTHGREHDTALGRLVANSTGVELWRLVEAYGARFM